MAEEDLKIRSRSGTNHGTVIRQTQQRVRDDGSRGAIQNVADPISVSFSETQTTASENHPWPPRRGAAVGDVGGSFSSQRQFVVYNGGSSRIKLVKRFGLIDDPYATTFEFVFDGKILPVLTTQYPPSGSSSENRLNQLGATAVARCSPTNSVANASTFLGELVKDGLPSLIGSQFWKDRSRPAKSAGSEYLNIQFGWRPLVSDIGKFAKAVTHADTVMKQYERDAGRIVRRRYNFPLHEEREQISSGQFGGSPTYSEFFEPGPRGSTVLTRKTVRRTWFSGAFTYHLPSGYDSRNKLSEFALKADKLLGLNLSPEVLWNVAPWSWAVDWFSSSGDVIHNLDAMKIGGLVMRYGYLMEHTIVTDTYSCHDVQLINGHKVPPISFVTETKLRRRANPFGFGVSWDGLSPYQASIAAALGLSRRG